MPQTLTNLLVHIVFSTKLRRPFITPEIEPELFAYFSALCAERGTPCLAVGGTNDHVHLLISHSRTKALSDIVRDLKAYSSNWLKTRGPAFREFSWQDGYGGFSIGQSGVAALRRYIRDQRTHHQTRSFSDEYRLLLRRYEVAFDERFLSE
jgi:putative transposase